MRSFLREECQSEPCFSEPCLKQKQQGRAMTKGQLKIRLSRHPQQIFQRLLKLGRAFTKPKPPISQDSRSQRSRKPRPQPSFVRKNLISGDIKVSETPTTALPKGLVLCSAAGKDIPIANPGVLAFSDLSSSKVVSGHFPRSLSRISDCWLECRVHTSLGKSEGVRDLAKAMMKKRRLNRELLAAPRG